MAYIRPIVGGADAENTRFGVKPVAAAPVDAGVATRAGARRALGDVATNVGAAVRATVAPIAAAAAVAPKAVLAPRAAALPIAGAGAASGVATASAATMAVEAEAAPRSGEALPADVHDVDAADARNPAAVSDYVQEIYRHYKSEELVKSPHFGYMMAQTDINEKMRAILLDWLVEVHLKFRLMPETLYLTVNLIDRFLERKMVVRQKLQLVGVTAMLLASKYEEIYAPEVRDFVYITDKAYTREHILQMESAMLTALEFRITVPTAYVFVNRYLKVAGADERTTLLATYFVERTLQEYRMLAHLPSKVAAAGVNMALRTLRGRDAWTSTLAFYSGYSAEDLRAPVTDIQDILVAGAASSLQAVRKKYQNPKFGEVANIPFAPLE